MDRRDFLGASIGALGLSMFSMSCSTSSPTPQNVAGKRTAGTLVSASVFGDKTHLHFLDLDTGAEDKQILPLMAPHTIYRSYTNPDEVYIFEVLGKAGVYNLKTRRWREATMDSDRVFSGHALQMGEVLWCTEEHKGARLLRRYSADTLRPLKGTSHVYEAGHSVARVPGQPVIVTGGILGSNGFLSFIDSESGKLIKRDFLPTVPIHYATLTPSELIFIGCSTCLVPGSLVCNEDERHMAAQLPNFPHDSLDPIWRVRALNGAWSRPEPLLNHQRPDIVLGGLFMTKVNSAQFVTSHKTKDALALWEDGRVREVFPALEPHDMAVSADAKKLVINGKEGLSIYDLERPGSARKLIPGKKAVLVTCLAPV